MSESSYSQRRVSSLMNYSNVALRVYVCLCVCVPVCHRYLLSVEILEARRNLYLQIPLCVT